MRCALKWITDYDLLKEAGCRNIREYNEFVSRKLNPEKDISHLAFIGAGGGRFADPDRDGGQSPGNTDRRLAQLAVRVGIHLIIATQRPSVNIHRNHQGQLPGTDRSR